MKNPKIKFFVALVFTFSLALGTGVAQTPSGEGSAKVVSVTGCLVKGDEPQEVWLAEKDGTIYGLESSKIKLAAHLGHKVVVRGYVLPEGKEETGEGTQAQNKTGKHETGDFRVLTLKMISTTCP